MTSSFKSALVLLALGVATVPAVSAQDRAPRAGAPTAIVVMSETAPEARRPRSGAPIAVVAPASAEVALGGVLLTDSSEVTGGPDLCGRKYCGAANAR